MLMQIDRSATRNHAEESHRPGIRDADVVVDLAGFVRRFIATKRGMKFRYAWLWLFVIATAIGLGAGLYAASPQALEDELLRHTQELLDAVVPGNQEPWKKYFADDCIFADEKGRSLTKAQLVADITPLPNGYSGQIKIGKHKSVINGDTAILSYDTDESETIFGQELHARYHVTDTWLRRNNVWQIAASQTMRYYEDPAVGKIDIAKIDNFVGTYELAPGQARTVSREGDKLFVERNGKRDELLPESCDIFFRKGVEGRILFRYNNDDKVDALIDRRNNEDVIWRKVK
jgi:hypothetical protein